MVRATLWKFFADRGTHLAAMIAYFALLSFVPLLFLALALLGFAGRPHETSYLVRELGRAFPTTSVDSIVKVVRTLQRHATALGLIGGLGLLWSSLSLFSALESALNIVYGKPNRSFLRGKGLALLLMVTSLVTLFAGLLVGGFGADILNRYAPGILGSGIVAYAVSVLASTLGVFVFLVAVYYRLTNIPQRVRDVLPGAIVATVLLEASFQLLLPLFLRLTNEVVALQALGGPAVLLVWLYVMGNLIVYGAEINWWYANAAPGRRRNPRRLRGARRRLARGASGDASSRRRVRRPFSSRPPG
jgi:membrane protein